MEIFDREKHWENIYQTKAQNEVSWYQTQPKTSLNFIEKSGLPMSAKIIDVGGGDGFLVDCLLEAGYTDITVLDISATAIQKAQNRLGAKADLVKWIVSDITAVEPSEKYDVWHDRAVFHFLIDEIDIQKYQKIVANSLQENGLVIVGTFSENGPQKCSGIVIKQYSKDTMTAAFAPNFEKIDCLIEDHKTPFDTLQNFVFCSFRKK